jgi:uncharacterized protein
MEITWREEKRRLKLRKHGLDFTLAQQVVSDPLAVTVFDRVQDGQERWYTTGAILTETSFKVVVAYTVAVGDRVTPAPPLRSRRAAFPHRAPAEGRTQPEFGAWAAHSPPVRRLAASGACLARH